MEPNVLITQLYVGYYNRAPDPEGLNYWIGRYKAGVSLADIADSFAASPEAIATYPYLAFPNVSTAETFLEQVYQNLFNRAIDADGRAYYANKLATGQTTPGQIIAEIQANANTNPNNTDGQVLANKVTVGLDFALEAASTPGFKYEGAAVNQANTILDSVGSSQASVDAALASNDAFFGEGGAGTPGERFMLTTGIDNIQGGTGNDTITATISASGTSNTSTYQTGDVVKGGAGNDTLNLTLTSGNLSDALVDLDSVETVSIRNASSGKNNALDASGWEGVKVIESNRSAQTVAVDNIQSNVTLSLKDTAAGIEADFAAKAIGSAGTLTVNVEDASGYVDAGVGSGTEKFTSLAVNATGANYLGVVAGTSIKSVSVSGDGFVYLDNAGGTYENVTTVDASANNGGVFLDLNENTKDVTFTGGAGNDFLSLDEDQINADDELDGGAGVDTLFINAGNVGALDAGNTKNFEYLALSADTDTAGATVTVDGDEFGFQGVILGDDFDDATLATSVVLEDFTDDTLYVGNDVGGVISYDDTDAANIAVGAPAEYNALLEEIYGTAPTADVTIAGLDLSEVADASFSVAGKDDGLTLTSLTLEGTETLTFSGKGDVTISAVTETGKALTSIDLSGLTGTFDNAAAALDQPQVSQFANTVDEILIGNLADGSEIAVATGGSTTFVFGDELDGDVAIVGFDEGVGGDVVDLSGLGDYTVSYTTEGAVFEFEGQDGSVTLVGVTQGDLQDSNIIA